jgi:hypothetical protein
MSLRYFTHENCQKMLMIEAIKLHTYEEMRLDLENKERME